MNSLFASQRPRRVSHPRARLHAHARPSVCAFGESARWRKHRCGAQPRRAPQLPPQQPPSLPTREMAKKAKKAPEEEAPKKGKKKSAAKK